MLVCSGDEPYQAAGAPATAAVVDLSSLVAAGGAAAPSEADYIQRLAARQVQ